MAKAVKCDCCGRYIDCMPDAKKIVLIRTETHYNVFKNPINGLVGKFMPDTENTMDICPDCDKAIGEIFLLCKKLGLFKQRSEPLLRNAKLQEY